MAFLVAVITHDSTDITILVLFLLFRGVNGVVASGRGILTPFSFYPEPPLRVFPVFLALL